MTDCSTGLPFALKRLASLELPARAAIADRFPGTLAGLSLKGLAALLETEAVEIHVAGIEHAPRRLPKDVVPLAVTTTQDPGSQRMVIGLSNRLVSHLVRWTLHRPDFPGDTQQGGHVRLTSGEQGVLLFALDVAGADWIASGGGHFVIRSILEDADQVLDYLGEAPIWQISSRVVLDGTAYDGWLWSLEGPSAPRASRASSPHRGLGEWEIDLSVCVGMSRVTASGLQGLARGDGVVLDCWNHPLFGESGSCPTLISGGWRRFGRWLDKRRFEVIPVRERALDMKTNQRNDKPLTASLTPAPGGDTNDLEVMIRVEVGEMRLTVDKARGLVPGRVISLNRAVGPEVALRVGDRIVARGELVDYQGTLAVEVKEIP